MKKKNFKRIVAAALALMMAIPSAGSLATVQAASSETQRESDKEVVSASAYDATKREQNFDADWKFYFGDLSGAESTAFDDSAWENVTLPHDYSIEQDYTKSGEAESGYLLGGIGWYRKHFTITSDVEGKEVRIDFGGVYMDSTIWVNGVQVGAHPYGYTPFSFDISDYLVYGGENVITVKVNHQVPSSRWYSGSGIYRSVNLTVMDKVHVGLYGTEITTPNLETEKNGTVNMNVITTVANEGSAAKSVVLTHTVYEKGTKNAIGTVTTTAQSVAAGAEADITATLPAANPKLWSVDEPNLYTVVTEVKVGGAVVDTYDTEYGFRYFEFDSATGFSLNGEKMKIKGVCMHHDQGSLGAEAHARAIERQVEILKEMGCNSIRVTHNPAADELIKACNEQGILLVEEFFDGWMYAKNGNRYDYARFFNGTIGADNEILGATDGMTWSEFDLTATVKRGYNAPSIIMWSLGNEVWEGIYNDSQEYVDQAARLANLVKNLDTTRPSTIGDNKLKEQNRFSYGMAEELIKVNGIIGGNYCNGSHYDSLHSRYPNAPLYGSETASAVNSRGVYYSIASNSLTSDKTLTAYDYSAVGWGAVASSAWYEIIQRDFVAGEYVWTGFDYMGEPTPSNGTGTGAVGAWPSPKNSFFGIIDTAGLPKDTYYFYQSQWNDDVNTLHVLPAWNSDVVYRNSSGKVPVVVYTDAASVKLEYVAPNGAVTDLGTKTFTTKTTNAGYTYQMYEGSDKESTTHRNMYLTWYVPYQDGTVRAIAYDAQGNVISNTEGRSYVTTTGAEAQLEAEVDRQTINADGKDLAYITVNVTDAEGNIVPDATNRVTFDVDGAGILVGVDNGKQADHQSFQDDNRQAFSGSLIAIVQSTKEAGTITVTATASGLKSDTVEITTAAVDGSDGEGKQVDSFYMTKNYYVKVGNTVVLPEEIEVRYTDGTSEELPVVWDTANLPTEGTFTVAGVVGEEYPVSVTVYMIDEVGAVLNYSTTTSVGSAPTLPETRPAVSVDGVVLKAAFPVTWEAADEDAYDAVGTVVVEGTADVFGQEIPVTASVRVQEATVTVGDNIASAAMTLTQNIPEGDQSDTLTAIVDGSTTKSDNIDGGANESMWSNYDYSQKGNTTAELVFEYATQDRFKEVVIYFARDGYSAEYPDAGATKIMISENGTEWTEVNATETLGAASGDVKPYTYTFDAVTATFVKICITNSTANKTVEPCTGITEVELKRAVFGDFVTNETANIASMSVNDVDLSANQIADGEYYTLDKTANVEVEAADNAAITVLPAYNDEIHVFVESEDHDTLNEFVIYLGQEKPLTPADDDRDLASSKYTYSTGSEQPGTGVEGPVRLAFDGNEDTFWHSEWQPAWYGSQSCENYLWVQFDIKEPTVVDAIRYLARGGNGDIKNYRVEGKVSADAAWQTLTTGTWETGQQIWQLAKFDAVEVVALRLVAVGTTSDTVANKFAVARELRVRTATLSEAPEVPEVDKTALAAAIAAAEALSADDYTADSWTTFATALAAAKSVNANADATEADVAKAVADLAAAQDALEAKPVDPQPPVDPVNPFEDVYDTDYYYDPVMWAVEEGITDGWTPTLFAPEMGCTRGQVVTFLWRAAGEPEAENAENPFTDVAENAYYYDAVLWAVEEGITDGWTATTFAPDMTCTRGQIVTFIWRAAGEVEVTAENPFTDVAENAYYYDAILWAVENGITDGWTATTFAPEMDCTRGQIVTFLYRYYNPAE